MHVCGCVISGAAQAAEATDADATAADATKAQTDAAREARPVTPMRCRDIATHSHKKREGADLLMP